MILKRAIATNGTVFRRVAEGTYHTTRRPLVGPQRPPRTQLTRAFEASVMTRLTSDWTFSPLSADAEIRQAFRNLRARSRDLERNDGYGDHYFSLAEQNVIGSAGIGLQMKVRLAGTDDGTADKAPPLDKPTNRIIERAWKRQCRRRNYTVTRDQSAVAADKLIVRSVLRDGDLLIRKIPGYANDFGFAVQIIEGDYLDDLYSDFRAVPCNCPRERGLPFCQNGTHEVRMGVELHGDWKFPVAYWLLTAHPGDFLMGSAVYAQRRERVPVEEIIHPFIKKRPHQTRGIPAMASAMLRLHMLGGYAEAELVAARAGAQKMGFIESEVPESMFDEYFDPDKNAAEITGSPGEIEELPVGKRFKEWDPTHPNGNFGPFNKEQLRGIAAGVNVSYTSLSGNIEDVNFSSIRAGLLEEREGWKGLQTFFIDEVKQLIFEAWLECAILSGKLPLDFSRFDDYVDEEAVVWKPRRWPWVDPLKDVQAATQAVAANLDTKANIIANMAGGGTGDLEDVYAEIAYERELEETLGIAPIDPNAPPEDPDGDDDDDDDEDDDEEEEDTPSNHTAKRYPGQPRDEFGQFAGGGDGRHPGVGKEGNWESLGLPSAEGLAPSERPARISRERAFEKLATPYAKEDPIGNVIGFGSRLRQHLEEHIDQARARFLPHMEVAVEHPAEIWSENTDQGPRFKHIAAFTATNGTKSFIVVSHRLGETKANIVTGVPKKHAAINKARSGRLLYVRPSK